MSDFKAGQLVRARHNILDGYQLLVRQYDEGEIVDVKTIDDVGDGFTISVSFDGELIAVDPIEIEPLPETN